MGEKINHFFACGGALANVLENFEERSAQKKMAQIVYKVLQKQGTCIIEAGTGIGKTLAYLVPALFLNKKILVSTATKTLQDQIVGRDLPFLQKHFFPKMKYGLLKGRQNYLCKHQMSHLHLQATLNSVSELEDLRKILAWARTTPTGDLSEIVDSHRNSNSIMSLISASPERCRGNHCEFFNICFVTEARRRAAQIDVIVVNHHLLFADLSLKTRGLGDIIPEIDAIIVDEAHHLPEVIRYFFGIHYGTGDWKRILSEIKLLNSGTDSIGKLSTHIRLIDEIHEKIQTELIGFAKTNTSAHPTDYYTSNSTNRQWRMDLESIVQHTDENILVLLGQLRTAYDNLEGTFTHINEDVDSNLAEIISGVSKAAEDISRMDRNDYVYWVEWKKNAFVMHATPLDIGHITNSLFMECYPCVILTSATLATANDDGWSFDFYLKSLGLPESTPHYRFGSPYEYQQQMVIYIPTPSFPVPSNPHFVNSLADMACEILRISSGRALFLFTNYRTMETMGRILRERLDYPILVQGEMARGELLWEFRENITSVLLATKSFWEGIDVPGESLSALLIEKLPFTNPDDPILRGELMYYRKKGQNYFLNFQVPRAVLALRQGVGRLIRSIRDVGIVAIFDSRLRTAHYGKIFLQSLPSCHIVDSLDHLREEWLKMDKNRPILKK